MKSVPDRASPSKAQILTEVDAMLADLSEARCRCEAKGEHGLVQLARAHDCAIRLRQRIVEMPESSGILVRTAKSLAAVVRWCVELYSLLSLIDDVWRSCTLEESYGYFVAPKAGRRRTCQIGSTLRAPILRRLSRGNARPAWSCCVTPRVSLMFR